MKKVKVLHVLNELRPSGAESMLYSAADIFNDNNIDSSILSTGEVIGAFSDQLESVGFEITHLKFKRYYIFTSPVFLYCYFKYLKKNKFDAVHIHPERGNFMYALIARLAGVRNIVRTVHHIFPQSMTSAKAYFFRPVKIIQRWVMRNLLNVTIVSNSISGQRNEQVTYFSNNIIVPNWFDSNHYKPLSYDQHVLKKIDLRRFYKIDDNMLVFVSLGGNWVYKNYDLIIRAIATLPLDMKILYVQVGPQGEQQPLDRLASELNVSNKVRCVGVVENPIDFLHLSDVYIMPSSIEGFGVAAAEAMGAGLPVILSNRPALLDFNELSKGIIYTDPTIDGIAKSLLVASNKSSKERYDIGVKLSESVHKYYGIENGAKMYMRLYAGASLSVNSI